MQTGCHKCRPKSFLTFLALAVASSWIWCLSFQFQVLFTYHGCYYSSVANKDCVHGGHRSCSISVQLSSFLEVPESDMEHTTSTQHVICCLSLLHPITGKPNALSSWRSLLIDVRSGIRFSKPEIKSFCHSGFSIHLTRVTMRVWYQAVLLWLWLLITEIQIPFRFLWHGTYVIQCTFEYLNQQKR